MTFNVVQLGEFHSLLRKGRLQGCDILWLIGGHSSYEIYDNSGGSRIPKRGDASPTGGNNNPLFSRKLHGNGKNRR